MSAREAAERVTLVEREVLAGRGCLKTTWYIEAEGRWIPAGSVPTAVIHSNRPGPQTVWERTISLELPRGTRLLCLGEQPAPEQRRDALAYLRNDRQRPLRRIQRTFHVVGLSGRVELEDTRRPAGAPPACRPRGGARRP